MNSVDTKNFSPKNLSGEVHPKHSLLLGGLLGAAMILVDYYFIPGGVY